MNKLHKNAHAPIFRQFLAAVILFALCWALLQYAPEYWSIPIGLAALSIWNYIDVRQYYFAVNRSSILRRVRSPLFSVFHRKADSLPKAGDTVIVQERGHDPVQLIAGRTMLYFHHLSVNAQGDILPESIVTELSDTDHCPKYSRRDQRIPYRSIHCAEYFCTPLKKPDYRTKFQNTGLLRLSLGAKKRTVQELYILDGTTSAQMEELFRGNTELKLYTEYPFDGISIGRALSRMESAHHFWLLLRTITLLCTAAMMQCGMTAVGEICGLTAVIGEALLLLLFCAKGKTWIMRDIWNKRFTPEPDRIQQPEIEVTLLAPLLCMTLYFWNRHNLLEMGRYLCLSACAALLLLVIYCCRVRMERWNGTMAVICILWGAAAVQAFNCYADPHAPQVITSPVYDMRTNRALKGGVHYYVSVELPDGGRRSFSVPPRFYSALEIGDTVTVRQYPGLFGIGYAEVEQSVAEEDAENAS